MLYFALSDPVQTNEENPPSTRAAVFIRNSGTEEKTSVYLRGERSLAEGLEQIGRELSVELAGLMKNPASAYWQAELAVLGRLAERGPLAIADLSDLLGGVNPERLMLEISLKEGLLAVDGSKLALTERARRLLDLVNKETTG